MVLPGLPPRMLFFSHLRSSVREYLCYQAGRDPPRRPIGYPDNFGRAGESAAVLAGPVPGRALPGGHDGLGVQQAGSVLLP